MGKAPKRTSLRNTCPHSLHGPNSHCMPPHTAESHKAPSGTNLGLQLPTWSWTPSQPQVQLQPWPSVEAPVHRSGSHWCTSMLVARPTGTSVRTGHPGIRSPAGCHRVPGTSGTGVCLPKILGAPTHMSLHSQPPPQAPDLAASIHCRLGRTARNCKAPSGTSRAPPEPAEATAARHATSLHDHEVAKGLSLSHGKHDPWLQHIRGPPTRKR